MSSTTILPAPRDDGRIDAEPGIYPGVDFNTYCRIRAINHSSLMEGERSDEHMLYKLEHPEYEKETEATRFGHLFHLALLQPERYAVDVSPDYPINPKKEPYGWDTEARRKREVELGKMVVSATDRHRIAAMVARVLAHPEAEGLLRFKTSTEVVAVWDCPATGVRCKARIDLYAKRVALIDVKTTEDASKAEFIRSVSRYNYDSQGAFYLDGWRTLTGDDEMVFGILPVEKSETFGVGLFQATAGMIASGRYKYRSILRRYARCARTGIFEGYPKAAVMLDRPRWDTGPTEEYEDRPEPDDEDPFATRTEPAVAFNFKAGTGEES